MRTSRNISPTRGRRVAGTLPLAAALAGALALAGPVASASAATATTATPGTAQIAGTQPAWATASADRGTVAAGTPVSTTVYLADRDRSGLAAYASAVVDPASAAYHRFLTPKQFQAAYGPSAQQIAAVEAWLKSAGLQVEQADADAITVSGTAAATERAYGTRLDDYAVSGKVFRAPTHDAEVPASVAGDVLTVADLDNDPVVMKPAGLVGTATTPSVPGVTNAVAPQSIGADGATYLGATPCSSYYGQNVDSAEAGYAYAGCGYVPSQFRGAYGVTGSGETGKGVTIAIVDAYGSPTILADANQYATGHGDPAFAAGQFIDTENSSQWEDQSACKGPSGWDGEESLDVEAAHAMATGADVHYYGANSCEDADFLSVFSTIVNTDSAQIVSNSWSEPVYSTSGDEPTATMAEYTQLFEQGSTEGISFQFATGDCGADVPSTSCGQTVDSSTAQAAFPASDPYATAVGGNSLAIGKQNTSLWTTSWGTDVWTLDSTTGSWDSAGWQYGGGGGTSNYFAQPSYQSGVVPASVSETLPGGSALNKPMRSTPDVSLDADPFTGFLVGMTQALPDGGTGYAESSIGGTSLACPLFAGLQADAIQAQGGQSIGFANPGIYSRAGSSAFQDVTGTGTGYSTYNVMAAYGTQPTLAMNFGEDQPLTAGPGFDDATGVGTPSAGYLSSY